MLPCRCTLLPPAAWRSLTGVIVTVRQRRHWSATLLDRRTGLRQALHFWIGVYIRPYTQKFARRSYSTMEEPNETNDAVEDLVDARTDVIAFVDRTLKVLRTYLLKYSR